VASSHKTSPVRLLGWNTEYPPALSAETVSKLLPNVNTVSRDAPI
jgi:hypothetical protein